MIINSETYLLIRAINIAYLVILCFSCHNEGSSQTNLSEITPKTYTAYYTNEAITIDGLGLEKSWEQAKYSDVFIDIEGVKTPTYNTRFKILWNEKYLYFLAEMEEPHVWGNLKQRDTIIFHNNNFEIFIDPNGDAHNYHELEFNALNTLWDLFITKPYRDNNIVLNDWTATGIKSAVHVKGTLNNSSDTDTGWQIEIAIPLSVFKTSYFEKIDLENSFWRMNFSRVNWDFQLNEGIYERKINSDGKLAHEYNWVWSPQGVVAMHQPETWGYVFFSKDKNKVFKIPKDEHLKSHLFTLHKMMKKDSVSHKGIEKPVSILNKVIKPKLEIHKSGYNIWMISPFSNKTHLITEDGKLLVK